MRLFRQSRRGVWRDVFETMAARSSLPICERRAAPRMLVGAMLARGIDRQDHHPAHQGRTHRGERKTRERPARTGLARAAGAGGRRVRPPIDLLTNQLAAVNARLWAIEDAIRACEREGDFGPRFVALARSVYRENDTRAAIKRAINTLASSALVEEKSYA